MVMQRAWFGVLVGVHAFVMVVALVFALLQVFTIVDLLLLFLVP